MARKKSYKLSDGIRAGMPESDRSDSAAPRVAPGVRIDMPALLGSDARFTGGSKVLDHSQWLGRGIDAWVEAAAASLRSLLMSGTRQPATLSSYSRSLGFFFDYLAQSQMAPPATGPACLRPLHVEQFTEWLKIKEKVCSWRPSTTRGVYKSIKPVLLEMFALGHIPGEPSRFFKRGPLTWRSEGTGLQTSLSQPEQERLGVILVSVPIVAP